MRLHQVVGGDLLWSRKSLAQIFGTFWFVTAQIFHPLKKTDRAGEKNACSIGRYRGIRVLLLEFTI
jgi:hypothetical protein